MQIVNTRENRANITYYRRSLFSKQGVNGYTTPNTRSNTWVFTIKRDEKYATQFNVMSRNSNTRRQGIFWLLTIPSYNFTPYLPPGCNWIRGQLERGNQTGYLHWQVITALSSKGSIATLRSIFGPANAELTRSEAACEYVWKEDTRVEGTQFELGCKPIRVNSKTDWESVWTAAITGKLMDIPAHCRISSYSALRSIRADHDAPRSMERRCNVFWGTTGTGKSRRAWDEAGMEAYCKDPRTKFWCGYKAEEHVVIDEFRGGIDVSHLLRWLDRYPVRVEIKGSSMPLNCKTFWITSNLSPDKWYPDVDEETMSALRRRLTITHFI